jgi:hypothetical protein
LLTLLVLELGDFIIPKGNLGNVHQCSDAFNVFGLLSNFFLNVSNLLFLGFSLEEIGK